MKDRGRTGSWKNVGSVTKTKSDGDVSEHESLFLPLIGWREERSVWRMRLPRDARDASRDSDSRLSQATCCPVFLTWLLVFYSGSQACFVDGNIISTKSSQPYLNPDSMNTPDAAMESISAPKGLHLWACCRLSSDKAV